MQDNLVFKQDESGNAAIEFALVSPILFLLIIGIVEFGMIMFANNVIENAAIAGARLGITNSTYASEPRVASGADRIEVIKNNIRARAGGFLDAAKVSVSCESLGNNFGSIPANQTGGFACGQVVDEATCSGAGAGGKNDAVIYTVGYCWDIITPLMSNFFPPNGEVYINSSLVVKNENF
jgi:Flp pilus assembly pilin Flp